MKTNPWLILGVLLSTSLLAQQAQPPADTTPAAPAAPAPAVEPAPAPTQPAETTPAPAVATEKKKKKHYKHGIKREMAQEPFVALVAGPAVVSGKNVNVRARPKTSSEVITRLNTGDSVTVVEQINLEKPAPGEPKQWAKIAFPSAASVWVNSSFVDASSMQVKAKKLNLRAGPGENYNVVGTLESGTAIKQVETKGDWMKIEPPADAYAFVAAQYLRQESGFQPNAATASSMAATNGTPEAVPAPPAMTEEPPATAPAPAPAPAETTAAPTAPAEAAPSAPTAPAPAEVITSAPTPATAAAATAEPAAPLPPRIVSHEGVVKPTVSIQAPTDFALMSIETGKMEDFLYTSTTNLDLSKYNGLHIVATGEESVDERWTNTPVLTIRRIQVVP